MTEITLSLFYSTDENQQTVRQVLSKFEQENHCQVNIHWLTWDTGHAELNQIAFHRRGADVSEIGTSWLGDYISMKALRPFTDQDIRDFGGLDAFVPASWISGQVDGEDNYFAIPWSTVLFILYYRREWLARAGVEESQAFPNSGALERTIEALASAGHPMPIAPALIADNYMLLHCIAPFVWNEDGQFKSDDGRQVLFNRPEALRGIARYFNLTRHLSQEARSQLNYQVTSILFDSGAAAVAFNYSRTLFDPTLVKAIRTDPWGVAPIPPASFVGGQSLVIWQHTRQENLAKALVNYLTSHEVQMEQSRITHHLPARISALEKVEFADSQIRDSIFLALHTGRTYRPMRLWSVIEERLVQALYSVWHKFSADPQQDVYVLLEETLNPLAKRLMLTLSQ